MKKHISFPDIKDFKTALNNITHMTRFRGLDESGKCIYDDTPLPTITFKGTVKLHGTNAGVCFNEESGIWFQAREDIIAVQKDNAGFAFFASTHSDAFMKIIRQIADDNGIDLNVCTISVYGEWAGCFSYNTPILLSDGSSILIGKLVNGKLPVEVMTYNKHTGRIEPKLVTGWHRNGRTNDWLKLTMKRRKRGGRGTSIICTPNHVIFTNSGGELCERPARELKVGDKVWVKCNVLNYTLKEFLKGTLLGDGSFSSKREITISHSNDDQPFYNTFIESIFSGISSSRDIISGYGANMRQHSIHAFPEVEDLYDELHKTDASHKLPTFEYLNTLSPIALAAWYMDDGSLSKHTEENRQDKACFHVEGFGDASVEVIAAWLNSRGFECNTIINSRGRLEIRLTAHGTNILLYQISPYMLPEFNYKLPVYLHDIPKIEWWKHIVGEYDSNILSTEIESISPYIHDNEYDTERYDITVDGNSNYFANGVLVHNSGIQKGVAINELPKTFYLFGVKISKPQDEDFRAYWVDSTKYIDIDNRIYNVDQFPTYTLDIDFDKPNIAAEKLTEITMAVEAECPTGKALGVSGIGEGVVWRGEYKGTTIRFKVKGPKHSVVKAKKVVEVDPVKLANITEFVDRTVTENRVEQAIQMTCSEPLDKSMLGPFLKWLVNDIIKEESHVLSENGLEPKDVTNYLSTRGREMFIRIYEGF